MLNILRWNSPRGDCPQAVPARAGPAPRRRSPATARRSSPGPSSPRPASPAPTCGGARFCGYRVTSTLVHHVAELARRGEPFIYAYYEGIDKVAHEYGLGPVYDAELQAADRLVGDLLSALPAGARCW